MIPFTLFLLAGVILPSPEGALPVGRDSVALGSQSAWVWYPTSSPKAPPTAPLIPPDLAADQASKLQRRLGEPAATALLNAKTSLTTAAPVAATRAPLLIFAPGQTWHPIDYTLLLAECASRGWIVLGLVPAGPAATAAEFWSALDSLGKSRWSNHIDFARVWLAGHSIGGAAAITAAAQLGPRVRGAINLDGDFMGDALDARPRQPVLYLTQQETFQGAASSFERSGRERSEARRTRDWSQVASQSSSAHRLILPQVRHLDWLDAAHLPLDTIPADRRAQRFGTLPASTLRCVTAAAIDALRDGKHPSALKPLLPGLEVH